MKLVAKTFKRDDYKVTSQFGYRKVINTNKGATASFHCGTDYGTNNEKWPQYALEEGLVTKGFKDSYGANCIYIKYPRIGKVLFYAHLDSICVKTNQVVNNNTIIGYTGKSGKVTGIHLHLGLKNIGETSWLDPEKYKYVEGNKISNNGILGSRGYIKLGDQGDNIARIASFMYKTFPAYTNKLALGNYYGPNIEKSIKEFQRRTNLEVDGCIGPKTLKKLESFGFVY